jgi:hypothetical protein
MKRSINRLKFYIVVQKEATMKRQIFLILLLIVWSTSAQALGPVNSPGPTGLSGHSTFASTAGNLNSADGHGWEFIADSRPDDLSAPVALSNNDLELATQCSQRVGPFATQSTAWQRWRQARSMGYAVSNGVVPCYQGGTRGYCFFVFYC